MQRTGSARDHCISHGPRRVTAPRRQRLPVPVTVGLQLTDQYFVRPRSPRKPPAAVPVTTTTGACGHMCRSEGQRSAVLSPGPADRRSDSTDWRRWLYQARAPFRAVPVNRGPYTAAQAPRVNPKPGHNPGVFLSGDCSLLCPFPVDFWDESDGYVCGGHVAGSKSWLKSRSYSTSRLTEFACRVVRRRNAVPSQMTASSSTRAGNSSSDR